MCPELPEIMNGFITYAPDDEADYDIGTVATYECNPGFILVGDMTRDCVQVDADTAEFNGVEPFCRGEFLLYYIISVLVACIKYRHIFH